MFIFASILIIGFGLWCLYGYLAVRGIETAHYTVKETKDSYEIRDYDASIIATTTVDGDMNAATIAGFKRVAGYIFGGNTLHQNIAMTAPVTTEQARADSEKSSSYTISFVMPSEYSMDSLPLPSDATVRVESVPAHTVAALTFYGSANETTVSEKMTELKTALEKDGYTVSGELTLAQYDPPFTPWFMRKNEVWAELLMER